jgi:hypothetical protein
VSCAKTKLLAICLAEHLVLGLRYGTPCRFAAISGMRQIHRWEPDHPALPEID